jgi:hypothetical protein
MERSNIDFSMLFDSFFFFWRMLYPFAISIEYVSYHFRSAGISPFFSSFALKDHEAARVAGRFNRTVGLSLLTDRDWNVSRH